MKLRLLTFVTVLTIAFAAVAQIVTPITWTSSIEMKSPKEGTLKFAATIEPGWHLYSTVIPDGGPNPTAVTYDKLEGVELVGDLIPSRPAPETVDMVFNLKLGWWTDEVTLSQDFRITDANDAYTIEGAVSFQGCN
ncbi:MAG: hypothetical protein K2L63_08145, partial [Paramuribaculum sp.]|nr:hypothetical protein [Paramuribaculum sp.]